jgi:hypothetical protein
MAIQFLSVDNITYFFHESRRRRASGNNLTFRQVGLLYPMDIIVFYSALRTESSTDIFVPGALNKIQVAIHAPKFM